MPPFRPLVRHFPRPSSAVTANGARSPYLLSMSAVSSSSFQGPQSQSAAQQQSVTRPFSSSAVRPAGDDTHYEPPGGWLFGVPPGEKKEKEGWEQVWVWGFWGSLAVAVVAYAYKPDTSIQTWALEEARRRLEAEGILPDPQTKN